MRGVLFTGQLLTISVYHLFERGSLASFNLLDSLQVKAIP